MNETCSPQNARAANERMLSGKVGFGIMRHVGV
jgi:hypothetical protein